MKVYRIYNKRTEEYVINTPNSSAPASCWDEKASAGRIRGRQRWVDKADLEIHTFTLVRDEN